MGSTVAGYRAHSWLLGLVIATGLGMSTSVSTSEGVARAQQSPLVQGASNGESRPALSRDRARAAAERILRTLQHGDATTRYAQFSEDLKRVTSPAMVAATMKDQPRIRSFRIDRVEPGYLNTQVEASLTTSAGPRRILLILDENGFLEGYNIDRADASATKVAESFMGYVLKGHYISARSFLSPELQEEITPAELQTRWQNLQKRTGNAVRVRRIALAETAGDQKLVLVTTEFTRLTESIFVVLDQKNQIISLDFPLEPAAPTPAP